MKLLFKLAVLTCLSCTAMQAGSFLVLLQTSAGKYWRAEQSGGRIVYGDTNTYGDPRLAFIIEDTWAGTPWLVQGDPFWIRSEMNNMYFSTRFDQGSGGMIRVDRSAPGPNGTEAFQHVGTFGYYTQMAISTIWGTGYNATIDRYHTYLYPDAYDHNNAMTWYLDFVNPMPNMNNTVTILAVY